MSVNVIRKQSGQANEVTDAMLEAGKQMFCKTYASDDILKERCAILYKAMEAARIAEGGEIDRIEVVGVEYNDIEVCDSSDRINFIDRTDGDQIWIDKSNLIPLAEALLELGKQMKGAV